MKIFFCLTLLIFNMNLSQACTIKVTELMGPELAKDLASEYFEWNYDVDPNSSDIQVSISCWSEDTVSRCRAISREGRMTYLSNRVRHDQFRRPSEYRVWNTLIRKTVEGLNLCEERSTED